MVGPLFNKRFGVDDKAFAAGRRPGDGYGPFEGRPVDPKTFASQFGSTARFNPGKTGFWNDIFSSETADQSQSKIDQAASSDSPNFSNPEDNRIASDFLQKYSQDKVNGAVARGLVLEEDAVSSETAARMATQRATFGSNQKSPDTTSQFPSQGVSVG